MTVAGWLTTAGDTRPRSVLRAVALGLLDRDSRTWCDERTGALSKKQAEQIVGHSNVTIRPVLDLGADLTYTGYVAPPNLKEQLALRNGGYCTFPHCHRARAGDVDHQDPAARSQPPTAPQHQARRRGMVADLGSLGRLGPAHRGRARAHLRPHQQLLRATPADLGAF